MKNSIHLQQFNVFYNFLISQNNFTTLFKTATRDFNCDNCDFALQLAKIVKRL